MIFVPVLQTSEESVSAGRYEGGEHVGGPAETSKANIRSCSFGGSAVVVL